MRIRPIDKRALIHEVEWITKKLTKESEKFNIKLVRLNPGYVVDNQGSQQSSYDNYTMYYDCQWSTKINGEIPKFSVGDSVRIIKGPINGYPQLLKIINIWQFFDLDGKNLHHIEILLR